jgi:hypothetical protein
MAYTSLSFKREHRRRMCGLYISQLQKRAKKEDVWLIHLSASKESKEGGCVALSAKILHTQITCAVGKHIYLFQKMIFVPKEDADTPCSRSSLLSKKGMCLHCPKSQ